MSIEILLGFFVLIFLLAIFGNRLFRKTCYYCKRRTSKVTKFILAKRKKIYVCNRCFDEVSVQRVLMGWVRK